MRDGRFTQIADDGSKPGIDHSLTDEEPWLCDRIRSSWKATHVTGEEWRQVVVKCGS